MMPRPNYIRNKGERVENRLSATHSDSTAVFKLSSSAT